jgi:hypothetical protein
MLLLASAYIANLQHASSDNLLPACARELLVSLAGEPVFCAHSSEDIDQDGIPDAVEQQLAEQYAPVILMEANEPNLP